MILCPSPKRSIDLVFGEPDGGRTRVRPRVYGPEAETRGHSLADIRGAVVIFKNSPHRAKSWVGPELILHVVRQARVKQHLGVPDQVTDYLAIPEISLKEDSV